MTTLSKTTSSTSGILINLLKGIFLFPIKFFRLLISLEQSIAEDHKRRRENFLAESTDIYDLEARMRDWDRKHGY